MSTFEQHPKFVMQVQREEPVPKLVSINDFSLNSSNIPTGKKDRLSKTGFRQKSLQKVNKNFTNNFYDSRQDQSLLDENRSNIFYTTQSQANYGTNEFTSSNGENVTVPQNQINAPSSMFYTTARKQLPVTEARNYRLEVIQLEKLLEIEREEKLQLQQIIKQLTVQSEKLKQVNDHIVERLKELEKNFVEEKMHQEKEQDERVRKVINQVYQDVESYVRNEVETLANKLKGEKMSPLLEKKLELFMESLLQINQNTVEMFKISQRRYSFNGNPLAQFVSDGTNEKENMTVSNLHLNHRINLLFDSKSKNESFVSRSSNKRRESSPRQGKRLINNAYISSGKKQSPSRVLFESSNKKKDLFPNEYTAILNQLQNKQETFREENFTRQVDRLDNQVKQTFRESLKNREQDDIPLDHIEFLNPFNTNRFQTNQRSRTENMEESYVGRKRYYETSKYDESNFHIREYTPNKRKRIFAEPPSKSKSKLYQTSVNQSLM